MRETVQEKFGKNYDPSYFFQHPLLDQSFQYSHRVKIEGWAGKVIFRRCFKQVPESISKIPFNSICGI